MFKFRASKLFAGEGCRNYTGEIIKSYKEETGKVMLITGSNTGNTVFCREVIKSLEAEGIYVISWKGVKRPSEKVVNEGFKIATAEKPDAFVAFGGGSVIDSTKMINVCYAINKEIGRISQFEFKRKLKSLNLKPLIAIPTTFGTGSETTSAAVIEFGKKKRAFLHEILLPDIAILDWEITVPKKVAATSGMDAIMHAFEAYTCIDNKKFGDQDIYCGSNKITDSLAENALKHLKHLPNYVNSGKNAENVALGAHMAGIAFGNAGVHFAHAASYALSEITGEAHGVCVASVGQALLEFLKTINTVESNKVSEKAYRVEELLGDSIDNIRKNVGLPSLKEMGINESMLPKIADRIMEIKRLIALRPEIDRDSAIKILKMALEY